MMVSLSLSLSEATIVPMAGSFSIKQTEQLMAAACKVQRKQVSSQLADLQSVLCHLVQTQVAWGCVRSNWWDDPASRTHT